MRRHEFTNCADIVYLNAMLRKSVLIFLGILMSFSLWTQSADFFDADIVEIDIVFYDDGWRDTLIARKQRNDKGTLLTTVAINGEEYEEVEVRYKGNSSFHGALKQGWQKFPLRLKSAKGHSFANRYKKLRLANNYRDPSAIRELLAYEIAGTYVPVPKVISASVTINGEFAGLYTLTEGIANTMISDYYCDDSGVLIQCEPDHKATLKPGCPKGDYASLVYLGEESTCYKRLYEIETKKESKSLIELIRRLERDKRIDTVIDIHQTLWMHAINNVLVNLDSYLGLFCHNYFVYQDNHGIYHPLIWDLNLAFGGFSLIASGESPDPIKLSPIVHDRYLKGKRPLIQKLMQDKVAVRLYFWMMKTIVEDWISSGKYLEVASELQERIRPYVKQEKDALYSISDFDKSMWQTIKHDGHRSIIGIAQLMEPRAEYLLNHVLLNKQSPVARDWKADISDQKLTITLNTSDEVNQVRLRYKSDSCGKYYEDLMTQVSIGAWQFDIPVGCSFYFVLSSKTGSSLYPMHAPLELLMSS